MIRLLIADDHQLMRQGLRAMLSKAPDVEIIGEARDGREAVELAERLQPDIVLMDIAMPIMDGLRAAERIHAEPDGPRVVMLSMYSDAMLVQRALQIGASGYLIKNGSLNELLSAIRVVSEGKTFFSSSVAETASSVLRE